MLQHAHVHLPQRFLEPLRRRLIGTAWLKIPARMSVREDDHRIEAQGLLDHLARLDRSGVDGAVVHLPTLDQPVERIQKQHRKDFMLEACQLVAQVLLDQRRESELSTTLHLQFNGLECRFKNLIYLRWQAALLSVTHQRNVIERGKGQLRHDNAPVAQAGLPGIGPARRSASSQGSKAADR